MSGDWSWARIEEACEKLLAALDWEALGELYFHDGDAARWQELQPRVLTLGLDWARAALRRLPETGASLYAGAGVAELPVLLAERLLKGRTVWPVNRSERECEVLNQGLRRVGLSHRLLIRHGDAADTAQKGGYDHLGCVSLFTDPERWPLLSAVTYGRIAPVQLDVTAFAQERERARALAAALFGGLQRPGWITTSVDEVAWFAEQAERASVRLEADDAVVDTAVVGDPIGFAKVT